MPKEFNGKDFFYKKPIVHMHEVIHICIGVVTSTHIRNIIHSPAKKMAIKMRRIKKSYKNPAENRYIIMKMNLMKF